MKKNSWINIYFLDFKKFKFSWKFIFINLTQEYPLFIYILNFDWTVPSLTFLHLCLDLDDIFLFLDEVLKLCFIIRVLCFPNFLIVILNYPSTNGYSYLMLCIQPQNLTSTSIIVYFCSKKFLLFYRNIFYFFLKKYNNW